MYRSGLALLSISLVLTACGGSDDAKISAVECQSGMACSMTVQAHFEDAEPKGSVQAAILKNDGTVLSEGRLNCDVAKACVGTLTSAGLKPGLYTLKATEGADTFLGAASVRVRPDAAGKASLNPVISKTSTGFYIGRVLNARSDLTEKDIRRQVASLTSSPESAVEFYSGLGHHFFNSNGASAKQHEQIYAALLKSIESGTKPYDYVKSPVQNIGSSVGVSPFELFDFAVDVGLDVKSEAEQKEFSRSVMENFSQINGELVKFEGEVQAIGSQIIADLIQINQGVNNIIHTLEGIDTLLTDFENQYFTNEANGQHQYMLAMEDYLAGMWGQITNVTSNNTPACLISSGSFAPPLFIDDYIAKFSPALASNPNALQCVKGAMDQVFSSGNLNTLFTNAVQLSDDDVSTKNKNNGLQYLASVLHDYVIKYPDPSKSGNAARVQPLSQQYSNYNTLLANYIAEASSAVSNAYLLEAQAGYLNTLLGANGYPLFGYVMSEPFGNMPAQYNQTAIGACNGFSGKGYDDLCALNHIYKYRSQSISQTAVGSMLDYFHDDRLQKYLPDGNWKTGCVFSASVKDKVGNDRVGKPYVVEFDGVDLYAICPVTSNYVSNLHKHGANGRNLANCQDLYDSLPDYKGLLDQSGRGQMLLCNFYGNGSTVPAAVSHIDTSSCPNGKVDFSPAGYLRCQDDALTVDGFPKVRPGFSSAAIVSRGVGSNPFTVGNSSDPAFQIEALMLDGLSSFARLLPTSWSSGGDQSWYMRAYWKAATKDLHPAPGNTIPSVDLFFARDFAMYVFDSVDTWTVINGYDVEKYSDTFAHVGLSCLGAVDCADFFNTQGIGFAGSTVSPGKWAGLPVAGRSDQGYLFSPLPVGTRINDEPVVTSSVYIGVKGPFP